jgi:hypothetical protein
VSDFIWEEIKTISEIPEVVWICTRYHA